MLAANLIRQIAKCLIGSVAIVVPLAVCKRNRIYDKMIVKAICVKVRGDYHLKPLSPQAIGKLNADLVRFVGRYFTVFEALVCVKRDNAALLVELPLCHNHLLTGDFGDAIHAGYINTASRFYARLRRNS